MMKKLFVFLFALILCVKNVFSLVLEDLPKEDLKKLLSHKKIGFYVGSFDPIHKGHEQVVNHLLEQRLVDYIVIYPAWGGDPYKNRTDVSIRFSMLFSLYKTNPKVLISKLTPQQLQHLLTKNVAKGNKAPRIASSEGTDYIGILGSDTALSTAKDKKKLSIFMRGIAIPDKYREHTIGGIMTIPVKKFIVLLRNDDNLEPLKGKIGDRDILTIIPSPSKTASSSIAKVKIREGKPLENILSPSIIDTIKESNLYTH